ncbi:MAG TPA: hypothetical protein PK867_30725, partial [Pirellulales bacterium]|nr:hypothetical protein [Pirellulales bacterium]
MIVTYYYPWGFFYPVRSGADNTASRHLEYFRARGFRPRVIVANGLAHERRAFERYYHWADDLIVVDVPSHPEIHRQLDCWGFGSHLAG